MNRFSTLTFIFIGALQIAGAQDLTYCPGHETPGVIHGVSDSDRDRMLKDFGYPGDEASLITAVEDPRPGVRALAALKFAAIGKKEDLHILLRAWSVEEDICALTTMQLAISRFAPDIASDPRQHPGGQPRVAPFQACVASDPQVISLTLEQVVDPLYPTARVRVSARNVTQNTIGFLKPFSPDEEFSATVFDPNGSRAHIPRQQEDFYKPPVSGVSNLVTEEPAFLPIAPQREISWIWPVGDDFDMSLPGAYRVSFGGPLSYLGTTVCSNTADVIVGSEPVR